MEAGQSPPRRRPHAALAAAVRALREERRLPPACWLDRLFDATLSNTVTWSENRGLLMPALTQETLKPWITGSTESLARSALPQEMPRYRRRIHRRPGGPALTKNAEGRAVRHSLKKR
jgi:hypothetical protein